MKASYTLVDTDLARHCNLQLSALPNKPRVLPSLLRSQWVSRFHPHFPPERDRSSLASSLLFSKLNEAQVHTVGADGLRKLPLDKLSELVRSTFHRTGDVVSTLQLISTCDTGVYKPLFSRDWGFDKA